MRITPFLFATSIPNLYRSNDLSVTSKSSKMKAITTRRTRCIAQTTTTTSLHAIENDVLSMEDIVVGVGMALGLAFLSSYLQGQRSQSDIILWRQDQIDLLEPLSSGPSNETVVFGEDSWKEISRPENYVWYNADMRKKLENKDKQKTVFKAEKKWVLIALLLLFVPIFSFEFFLALSRQIVCYSSPFTQSDWAVWMCSPHTD